MTGSNPANFAQQAAYTGINLGALRTASGELADAGKLAFIGLDSDMAEQRVSFGELDAMADTVATQLLARGLKRGERVAILAANSIAYIAAFLAILRSGGVAVPVNYKFPKAMSDFVLQDSDSRIVFYDAARHDAVPATFLANAQAIALESLSARSADASDDVRNDAPPFPAVTPDAGETAMLLYTSGSTGTPKGVRLSHASHVWTAQTRLAADPLSKDRILIAAPLYHMNALALTLLTLAARATTVLLPQFIAAHYIEAISRYRCTWLTAVPPMIAMMLRETALLAQADLSSVRVIRMGSAPVSESLLLRIKALLPNARVINAYGTTEGGPVVFGPHPGGLPTPPMAVGAAHPLVALRLADANGAHGDTVHTGVLQMRSNGLMSGYHNRPALKPPFTDDGFYITGDIFTRDADGFYTFVGRHDDMFVSGGENIYPGDVEKMLERHPGVQQAVVVPVDDDIKGSKPVAFIVPLTTPEGQRTDAHLDAAEIKRFALEQAPAYQHPRHVWFVDAMPLASTNKIDRRALLLEARERLSKAAKAH